MSLAGEEDFAAALLKQTTELLGKAVVSLRSLIEEERNKRRTEVNSLKSENEQLKKRIKLLEEKDPNSKVEQLENRVYALENKPLNVTDQLTRAFTAAIAEVNLNTRTEETSIMDANNLGQNMQEIVSSTPVNAVKRKDEQVLSPDVFYQSKPKKRKEPTHTETYIRDIEDVDVNLREQLRPFYFENSKASSDLLEKLQKAFVKYHAHKIVQTNESITLVLTRRIIQEGLRERIWDSNFNPSENETFEKYLVNRLKNEKRSIKHQSALDTQSDMLNKYIATAINNPDQLEDPFDTSDS